MEENLDKKEPFVYQRKTDEEIKKIAMGILSGAIFSSDHIHDTAMINKVFLSVSFAVMQSSDFLKEMEDNKIVFFYEYIDKRGPRCINGLPQFFSCNMLNDDDYWRYIDMRKKLEEV